MQDRRSASDRKRYRTPRILVVDDHPDTRSILTEVLLNRGFRVETAENAVEAIEKASGWKPDVAILDLALPGIDGFSLTARLKAAEPTRDLPLVAYTAYTDPETLERAKRTGCARVLTKPTPSGDLVATLKHLLPPDTRLAVEGDDAGPDDTWVRLRKLRSDYQEALPRRIQRLAELWEEIRSAERLDMVQRDVLSLELHRLAGSASTYGFPELSRCAGKLSRAVDALRYRSGASGRRRADRLMEELQDEARRWGRAGWHRGAPSGGAWAEVGEG